MADSKKFQLAIARFDDANSKDPNKEIVEGQEFPKELLYAQRMSHWLEKLEPGASEALKLAARSQHICRWMIPRNKYPKNRQGYLEWRTTLYNFHAEKAGGILKEAGYDESAISRVQTLLRKQNIKTDAETQALEDVICLVFLENYFADFSKQHGEQKIINILRKTWKKMSPKAQKSALSLAHALPHDARTLIEKTLIGKLKQE